jgi:regulator of replication initiation timing
LAIDASDSGELRMSQRLSVPDIAGIIGVEEDIITNTLAREDEDLKPYLYVEPVITSHSDGSLETLFGGEKKETEEPQTEFMLSVDGLSVLITKLAFNIPTSDLIENLACQVLHLTVLQEDIAELKRENQGLQLRNEELQQRINELQTEVLNLKAKAVEETETQSRGWFRGLFGTGKSRTQSSKD